MLVMGSLHILCFGNSITAGWTSLGGEFHPYNSSMLKSLEKSFPSIEVTADVQGNPGDQVVSPPGGYLPRMDILYEETKTPYDWAIILGGTNDLAVGRAPADIWKGLKKVYDIPLSNNTKVLALTVPECGDCADFPDTRRDKLNKAILNYTAENFYTFDLHSAFPYRSLTDKRRKELWSDGIHPSAAGYDVMGSLLADRMKELISDSTGLSPVQEPLRTELKVRAVKAAKEERAVGDRVLRSGRVVA